MRAEYGDGLKYARMVEIGYRAAELGDEDSSACFSCTGKSIYSACPQFFEEVVPALEKGICVKCRVTVESVMENIGRRLSEERCTPSRSRKRIKFLLLAKETTVDAVRKAVQGREAAEKVDSVVKSICDGMAYICVMTARSCYDRPSDLFYNLVKTGTLEKYVFPNSGISFHWLAAVENSRELVEKSASEYVKPSDIDERVIEPNCRLFLDSYPVLRVELQAASRRHPFLRKPILETTDAYFTKNRARFLT